MGKSGFQISQVVFMLFFEPFKYLRFGDGPFRSMRIERARSDMLGFGQFRFRKFLGLDLTAKCFGPPRVLSIPPWQFK
jgi:hypothetical protein